MKVILKKDVKDVGRAGDMINVAPGFARNFLFPQKLAWEATESRVQEWDHLHRVAEVKKKKAAVLRADVLAKIAGTTVIFKVNAGKGDKIFGSVTSADIAQQLQKQGFDVDKKDIHLPDPIKLLGQHKAVIKLGGQEGNVTISVERSEDAPPAVQ
jgi:large subunit ribosomal protein L9